MKHFLIIIATTMMLSGCCQNNEKTDIQKSNISESTIVDAIHKLKTKHPQATAGRIERGVRHTSSIWWPEDGSPEDFISFCEKSFVSDTIKLDEFFTKVSTHIETLYGHFNWMTLKLQEPVHLKFEIGRASCRERV